MSILPVNNKNKNKNKSTHIPLLQWQSAVTYQASIAFPNIKFITLNLRANKQNIHFNTQGQTTVIS